MLRIVRAADARDRFEDWRRSGAFRAVDAHPLYGAFGRAYYPAVFDAERRDETFAVVRDDTPQLIVLCSAGAGIIDYYGSPVAFFDGGDPHDGAAAAETAFRHLDNLARAHHAARVLIREDATEPASSAVGDLCQRRGLLALRCLHGLCELELGENGLRRALRKSYRSLVNWGRRSLTISYVNRLNPDRELFDAYQALHRRIAGRITRPQASWDAMFNWIAAGGGELSLGRLADGELVTGLMVVDGTTTAYYASAANDRDRFDKPISHWPLFNAIVRSRARDMRWFDLGDIPPQASVSAKEYNIGYFKSGFATQTAAWTHWSGTLRSEQPSAAIIAMKNA